MTTNEKLEYIKNVTGIKDSLIASFLNVRVTKLANKKDEISNLFNIVKMCEERDIDGNLIFNVLTEPIESPDMTLLDFVCGDAASYVINKFN